MDKNTSSQVQMFLRRAMCRIGGHPKSANHRTVVSQTTMEFLERLNEEPDSEASISGRCVFCSAVLWELWPSAVKYLQKKEKS